MTDATLVPAEPDAPAVPAELTLRLFGTFAATLGGLPLPRLRSRKEQYLLCLLALRSPRPAERLWLAGLLWPDCTEEAALFNLRRSLHFVRAALGKEHGPRLHSPTPATLVLNLDGADVDIAQFDAALRQKTPDALENALALCSRPLLEDCAEDWATAERATRQEALLAACETCGTACAAAGEHARAAHLLRRCLTLDPLREPLVRALMQTLAASGDAAGAMDTFRRFRRRLRRELDAAPAPETRTLLGHITDVLSPVPALSVRLPRPLTPLIGRRQEVRDTVAALDTSRLVTLIGTGGVGKTRLAIAAAEDMGEECEVCFVPLAALTQTALPDAVPLAAAVARALDIAGPCDTTETLVGHLRERSILLVLDNCEHIIDACAAFTSALLEGCARLRVLATSRQPLGLPGEVVHPVPLLSVPSASDTFHPATDYDAVQKYDAVQLFVARAQAARPSFSPDPRTLPAVVRICRRLDGLPLAIELAAARVRSLPCEQIADKLDDRFSLLASGNRGALPRHQTLRAAVDWSYDLLTEAERLLLCRLSVFAGGWTADAAEAVCADGGVPVLDALSGLVDKSLVQMNETADGTARYFLLETLREYGQEKLEQAGQAEALHIRHAACFLALAEAASAHMTGPEETRWLSRLEAEHDNLRAAIDWFLQTEGQTTGAMRLCQALTRFWYIRGPLSEGRRFVTASLSRGDASHDLTLYAKTLHIAGALATHQGDSDAARACYEQCLPLLLTLGETRTVAVTRHNLAMLASAAGHYSAAMQGYLEALPIFHELGVPTLEANCNAGLGALCLFTGNMERARAYQEQALALWQEINDAIGVTLARHNLAETAFFSGDLTGAYHDYTEALALERKTDYKCGIANTLCGLGDVLRMQGEWQAARATLKESLSLFAAEENRHGLAYVLEGCASLSAACEQPERAVRLWGAALWPARTYQIAPAALLCAAS